MPQLLTSTPPAMSFEGPLSLARAKRRTLVLAAALLAGALGAGWLATLTLTPAPQPDAKAAPMGMDRKAINGLDLTSFQKRGSLLVGEANTPGGTRVRLVLDARTHELVGIRVVEPENTGR